MTLAKSIKEWSEAIGLSERFLWRDLKAGKIEYVRKGRRILITEVAINEYLDRDRIPAVETSVA